MSTAAGEYFSRQATEFGITAPPILDGKPMVLVDPDRRLSIHMADSIDHQELPQEIGRVTREQVVAIGDYLMRIAQIAYPDMKYLDVEAGPLRSGGFAARGFLSAFTPAQQRLKTGHIRNFIAEVVTPEDIPENIHEELLRTASSHTKHIRHITGYSAYLMTTADLYSGKYIGRLGNVSCIAVSGHGKAADGLPFSRIHRPPMAVSRPLSTNDMLAVRALQVSRDTAHQVKSHAMRHPYSGGLVH